MPNKTTNYSLSKPTLDENYDIEIQNNNMDIIDNEIKTVNTQLSEKANHTKFLSEFYQKLNKKEPIIGVAEGDSLSYGHDTVSSDKREPATTLTDNGVAHTTTRASITYPEALQTYLQTIYGNTTTIINKGYSGDYAELSYEHWGINSNADIAFIMLGTNDCNLGATYIPSDVKGNIKKYLEDMRKIIRRYISWGTAVILLTPPKLRDIEEPTTTDGRYIEPYRQALNKLGDEFGCPVIDTEPFMNGCDYTYYSDNVHFNGKGYQYFASRLVSILIGFASQQINAGDNITIRQTRDNMVNNGAYINFSTTAEGAEEGIDGNGIFATIGTNNSMYFGFETMEENLICIPIFSVERGTNGKIKVDLDFANEQGSSSILSAINSLIPQGTKPLSSIESITNTANSGGSAYNGTVNLTTTDRFILITNKGWHNFKVTNVGVDGSIYFNGFVIMSFKDFVAQKNIKDARDNITTLLSSTNIFNKLLYPEYTVSPTSVASLDIFATELNSFFAKNKLYNGEYWRAIPMKVTLHNYNLAIFEYGFIWHDNGIGNTPSAGFYSWLIKQTDLVTSPTGYRNITSITYDSTNRKYVVNFGGSLTYRCGITVSLL